MSGYRALLLGAIVLGAGCDPATIISSSAEIDAPVTVTCMVEVLRTTETIQTVRISSPELVVAQMMIPDEIEIASSEQLQGLNVQQLRTDGSYELTVDSSWFGAATMRSAGYRAYIERFVEDVLQRILRECGNEQA